MTALPIPPGFKCEGLTVHLGDGSQNFRVEFRDEGAGPYVSLATDDKEILLEPGELTAIAAWASDTCQALEAQAKAVGRG
jgi:hypothetical protein